MRKTMTALAACKTLRGLIWLLVLGMPLSSLAQNKMMDKRIDFDVDKVSVVEAMKALRQLSPVHLTYNVEELNAQPPVSVHLKNATTRKVLEAILEKTSLQYSETADEVTIFPRTDKKMGVRVKPVFFVVVRVSTGRGNPLDKVSILESEHGAGFTTSGDGSAKVLVCEGDQLKITYLGMKPVQYTVKGDGPIKIVMEEAPKVIDEVVVTGYQTLDKKLVAGSVYTLKGDDVITPGQTSVDQMLQGKVPGLMVVNTSGSPTATPTLRIRGTATFVGDASPLWVVDGVVQEDPVDLNPLQVNQLLSASNAANRAIVGNSIAGLNPYDIESITFLKDASATAIYGIRASSGVIVVTTKKGKEGPTQLQYSCNVGFNVRPSYNGINVMNSKERVDFSRDLMSDGIYYLTQPYNNSYEGLVAQLNDRSITQEEFVQKTQQLEAMNTDWLKLLFGNSFNQSHSVSISGGSGKTNYYTSLSYTDANGSANGDHETRYTGMFKLSTQLRTRVTLDLEFNGSLRQANGFFSVNPLDYALQTTRALSPDSSYITTLTTSMRTIGGYAYSPVHYNIFNEIAQTGSTSSTKTVMASANVHYRIWNGLSFSSMLSANSVENDAFQYATDHSFYVSDIRGYDFGAYPANSPQVKGSSLPYGGLAFPANTSNLAYDLRNSLEYSHTLFKGRDRFIAMAGQEITSVTTKGFSSQELGYFPDRGDTYYSTAYNNGSTVLANGSYNHYAQSTNQINNTLSYYATANYIIQSKYTLNANIRTDGSNRFGQYANQRFLPNWSVAGSWDMGEEPWFAKSMTINGLSLHASYGTQGSAVTEVGPNLIASYPMQALAAPENELQLYLQSLPYPDLRWEKTAQVNVGLNLNLFNSRINLTVEGYRRHSTNLLVTRPLPEEYGITTMYLNEGSMNNTGVDGNLNMVLIRRKNIGWDLTFVYGTVWNEVVQTGGIQNTYANYINGTVVQPGKATSAFWSYSYAGLSHTNGLPQFNRLQTSATDDPTLDPTTFLTYSGQLLPKVSAGFNTSFRYKSFTLDMQFAFNLGDKMRLNPVFANSNIFAVPEPTQNMSRDLLNRWRQPGDELRTDIPAIQNLNTSELPYVPGTAMTISPYNLWDQSTARVVSGNFLRCRTLGAAYIIPASMTRTFGIHAASLRASVGNPFLICSKKLEGQDPETAGTGGASLPIRPNYNLGVNINL